MKNILFTVLLFVSIIASAQFPTLSTTYTTGAGQLNSGISSTFNSGRLYHAMEKVGEGLVIQKSDANGTPILARSFNTFTVGWGNPKIISNNTGLFYVNRENSGILMLMRLDTTFCQPVFTRTYSVAGYNNIIHKDVRFLNSGKILIVGSAGNGSFTEDVGLVLCVDPAVNGAVVYSHTLSISGSTANAIHSVVETSNSSLILSGMASNFNFFSKALETSTTFTFVGGGTYYSNIGASKLYKLGNQKKLMVFKDVSPTMSAVSKIDTNLTLLFSTPLQNSIAWTHSTVIKSAYYLNKVYVWSNNDNYVNVIDSGLTAVSTKTFNINHGLVFRDMTNSLSNLYISQVRASPIDAKMGTIKADLNANMTCMNNFSVPTTSLSVNGTMISFITGSIVANTGFTNPVGMTLTLTSLQTCTCAPPAAPVMNTPTNNLNVCAGSSATLIATGSGTVNWYASGTSTTVLGSGSTFVTSTLSAGTYTFFADNATCMSSLNRSNIIVNVSPCTGIEEMDKLEQVLLYPNPTHGNLNIRVVSEVGIIILDVLGNKVSERQLQKGINTIDVRELNNGLYFVKVESGSHQRVVKFIKQ